MNKRRTFRHHSQASGASPDDMYCTAFRSLPLFAGSRETNNDYSAYDECIGCDCRGQRDEYDEHRRARWWSCFFYVRHESHVTGSRENGRRPAGANAEADILQPDREHFARRGHYDRDAVVLGDHRHACRSRQLGHHAVRADAGRHLRREHRNDIYRVASDPRFNLVGHLVADAFET